MNTSDVHDEIKTMGACARQLDKLQPESRGRVAEYLAKAYAEPFDSGRTADETLGEACQAQHSVEVADTEEAINACNPPEEARRQDGEVVERQG